MQANNSISKKEEEEDYVDFDEDIEEKKTGDQNGKQEVKAGYV